MNIALPTVYVNNSVSRFCPIIVIIYFIRSQIHSNTLILNNFTKLAHFPKRHPMSTEALQRETFEQKEVLSFCVVM